MNNNPYSQNPNDYGDFSSQNSSDYLNAVNNYQAGASAGFEGLSYTNSYQQANTALAQKVIRNSFLFMIVALLITAYGAFSATDTFIYWMASGNNFNIILFSELAIVLISNWAIRKNNAILAGILYVVYSYLTGALFSIILLAYTGSSIVSIFLITASLFAVMAVYGTVTKADLSSVGSICLMGLIGIIITSLVNMFLLHNSTVDTVICGIGVLIFVLLTAYDTQKIKRNAKYATNENALTLALCGAFELYLDFINIFLKLLRLFGKRK